MLNPDVDPESFLPRLAMKENMNKGYLSLLNRVMKKNKKGYVMLLNMVVKKKINCGCVSLINLVMKKKMNKDTGRFFYWSAPKSSKCQVT